MPWKSVHMEFYKRTGLEYSKDQLRHKLDWLKNRWSLWKALKRNETGLGFDSQNWKIIASKEWWQKKIEENVHFKQFQEEGVEPELESNMEMLFSVFVAQGFNKFTPAQREKETSILPPSLNLSDSFNLIEDDEDDDDDNFKEIDASNSKDTTQKWKEVWNTDDDVILLTGSTGESKRTLENKVSQSSKTNKKTSSNKKEAGVLMEQLNTMVKVVTERNTKDMVTPCCTVGVRKFTTCSLF
ncbi:hypothetical protein OROHE_005683 [Orobanche hederae]